MNVAVPLSWPRSVWLHLARALLGLSTVVPATALAVQDGDFQFQIVSEGVEVTRYVGLGGPVTVPADLGGHPVTGIGQAAFSGVTTLTSVTIPTRVTSIWYGAFDGCTGLADVTIPNSTTFIGPRAFFGCAALTRITIPSSVTVIGYDAFNACTGLTRVTLSSRVTSLGNGAFYGCTALTSVTTPNDGGIPIGAATIGDSVFYGCAALTTVTLPNRATSVGIDAFHGCTGLTRITIPDNVTSIGSGAFHGCRGLTDIALPGGVTTIGDAVFYGCAGLTSVTLPGSLTSLGDYSFQDCTGLTNVTIPSSVTSIGSGALYGCTGLTRVAIPGSVASLGTGVFDGCTRLAAIEVDPGNSFYSSLGGVLLNKSQSDIVKYPSGKQGPYEIPGGVTNIGDDEFSRCTGLTAVMIPSSVTRIGTRAFYGCTGLTSVTIPGSVTRIGSDAFYACGGLTGVTIPRGVTNIGDTAFYGCTGLISVAISDSVMSIGHGVFDGCAGLMAIDVDPGNAVYSSSGGVLLNKSQSEIVRYPAGKPGPYVIPASVTRIGNGAFYFCTRLTGVTLPSGMTNISDDAFVACAGLTSVTIPRSVTFIGARAFFFCRGLAGVYFEGSQPSTIDSAFQVSPYVTLFYRPEEAAGWPSTLAGRPTRVWRSRPSYVDWVVSTGLAAGFPATAGENDDPDGDGMSNRDEWLADTDPTQRDSYLTLELAPRTADLSDADRTPIPDGQHAVYFRSVPDRYYGVMRAVTLGGPWALQGTKVAAEGTSQTRFPLPKPQGQGFYRVVVFP